MMTMWYGSGWAWWQVGLMWVAVIVFLVLLIWVVYVLVAGITRRPERARSGGPESPQRILSERLARGGTATLKR
jgi:uncharacterized membrane protein